MICQRQWHTDFHPYPLRVSWPRRRTRWASLWSRVPVNRLAWYGPSPVWLPWTTERQTAIHPSSTRASFPDPIGSLAICPAVALQFYLSIRDCQFTLLTKTDHGDLDLDPDQVSATCSRLGTRQWRKKIKIKNAHFKHKLTYCSCCMYLKIMYMHSKINQWLQIFLCNIAYSPSSTVLSSTRKGTLLSL